MTAFADAPLPREGEISVFGRGVGECVVVHLGDGDWMVVDSCIGRERAVALEYLDGIGVNPASIKRLVISHWDDDHIRGAASVLDAAPNATWVASAALKAEEFKRLIVAGRTPHAASNTTEFDKLFSVQRGRKHGQRQESIGPHWALEGQCIWRTAAAEVEVLAPSPATMTLAHAEIGKLLPQIGEKRSSVSQGRNLLSIVLQVRLGTYPVLLGGDLEATSNPETGWEGVVRALVPPMRPGKLVKIPHHGSDGAHHAGMWSRLLEAMPLAVTTTYNPSGLPRPEDRARLRSLAAASYLTGRPGGPKAKRRFKDRAASEAFPHDLRWVLAGLGHVRFRMQLDDPTAVPAIDLFGTALQDSAA